MTALVLLLLAAPPPPSAAYVQIQNQGVSKGYARTINCSGSGVTCSVDTTNVATFSVTSTASDAGGLSVVIPKCDAGYVVDADGGAFYCTNIIATATALASTPSGCSSNQYANAIASSGNLTCAQVTTAQLSGTITNAQLASSYSGVGACSSHQWSSTLNANAAPTCTQPAYSDLSGSPIAGGSSPQVQYNSSGVLAGMTNYTSDGTRPIVTSETTLSTAPSAGTARRQDWAPTTAFPGIPFGIDSTLGAVPLGILAQFGKGARNNNWNYVCETVPYFGANGGATVGTNINTMTASNWSSNTPLTFDSGYSGQFPWIQGATTASANSASFLATPGKMAYTGPGPGMGGFILWQRIHIHASTLHTRQFYGLGPISSFTAAEPSSIQNTVYFGSEQSQMTLHICSNNTSASASCVDLGTNFPSAPDSGAAGAPVLNNQFYDLWLASGPNTTLSDGGTGIAYYVENIATGSSTSGTITAQLPDHGILMGVLDELNSADSGIVAQGYFNGMCLAYNY